MRNDRYEKQKGITLIALVVTIVVLIILATISVNIIFGEEGILEKARLAKQEMANAQEEEQHILADASNSIETHIAGERENTTSTSIELDYDNLINISSNLNAVNATYTFEKNGQLNVQMGIEAGGYYYTQIFHDNIAVNHINFHNSSSAGEQYTDHTIVNAGDTIKVTFYNKIQSDFNIIFVPFK